MYVKKNHQFLLSIKKRCTQNKAGSFFSASRCMAVADVQRESRSPQRRLLFDGASAVLLLVNWKQFPFPVEWAC